jgi:hypothetical protein
VAGWPTAAGRRAGGPAAGGPAAAGWLAGRQRLLGVERESGSSLDGGEGGLGPAEDDAAAVVAVEVVGAEALAEGALEAGPAGLEALGGLRLEHVVADVDAGGAVEGAQALEDLDEALVADVVPACRVRGRGWGGQAGRGRGAAGAARAGDAEGCGRAHQEMSTRIK